MFETDDFDLDEDFLNDIGKKEEEYYSQQSQAEDDRASKRRKTEIIQCDLSSDIIFDDEPDFAKVEIKRDSNSNGNSSVGSNKEISEESKSKDTLTVEKKELKNNQFISKEKENIEISRKSLALQILRKGSSSNEENTKEKSRSFGETSSNAASNFNIRNNKEEIYEKVSPYECFKKPATKDSPKTIIEKSSRKFISKDRYAAPRIPLVRKFPGPAGLLPDCPELCMDNINLSKQLCSNEANADRGDNGNEDSSSISEYLSQNTEKVFSSGAWRLMLDDLPENFLRGHDIASIKRTARNNSRVSLFAGVIQRIDHSLENPRLVLRDMTDSIEGTMHRDIPLAHPDTFEPGVVILLRNAGVLGFQASVNFPSLQFHIMIAPKNVLAVYSDKSRLVANPSFTHFRTSSSQKIENFDDNAFDDVNIDFEMDEEKDGATGRFDIDETTEKAKVTNPSSDTLAERKNENSIGSKEANTEPTNEKKIDNSTADMEIDVRPKKIETVSSRLKQFMSKHDPRADINEKPPCETSSKDPHALLKSDSDESLRTKSFGDYLLDSDNDTEDEILSQLDIDSIVTNYNSATR